MDESPAEASLNSQEICPGMRLLKGFAEPAEICRELYGLLEISTLRHMMTPGGHRMSAAMTNCGPWGWVTDRHGYRYQATDPETGQAWPAMPVQFKKLACTAAAAAGYQHFQPDACLVNCYQVGAQMTSHQDKDEADFTQPIVSVSLGLPARFFVQGEQRKGRSIPVDLQSGDVVVWGGPSRLFYHGVRPLKPGVDPLFGDRRFNLTFRRAR